MNLVKVSSGEYDVVSSGVVISFGESPIEILFKPIETSPPQNELALVFSFQKDTLPSEPRFESHVLVEKTRLEIRLFNFNSSIDTGSQSPLFIGTSTNNKKLYLNYRVRKTGDSWTLDYSIYQEK